MSCCDKKIKKAVNIVRGNINVIRGKKYEFTDGRVRICQKCEKNYWVGRTLWCSICKCFIPAKARVKEEKCPLDKWESDNGK